MADYTLTGSLTSSQPMTLSGTIETQHYTKWGKIGGTLSDQEDLQSALNEKAESTSLEDEITRATEAENTLTNNIAKCSLTTETGSIVDLELDTKSYILTAKLYDKNNNLISTSSQIDLPLETLILNVEYDTTKKAIIITLKDGTTKEIPIGDLVNGLVSIDTFNSEVSRAQLSEQEISARVKTIEDDYLKGEDKTTILQAIQDLKDYMTPPEGYSYLLVKGESD